MSYTIDTRYRERLYYSKRGLIKHSSIKKEDSLGRKRINDYAKELSASPQGLAYRTVWQWLHRRKKVDKVTIHITRSNDIRDYSEFFYWVAYYLGKK